MKRSLTAPLSECPRSGVDCAGSNAANGHLSLTSTHAGEARISPLGQQRSGSCTHPVPPPSAAHMSSDTAPPTELRLARLVLSA